MNGFIYDIPTKVYFGENQLGSLSKELEKFGNKVLLVYGGGSIKKTGLYNKVVNEIGKSKLELFELSGVEPNPKVDSVRNGAEICKKNGIEVILAVGGGSVIDASKFIGAAAFYSGDAWDLSTGKAKITKCLPIVTVLTLSATGSEMDCGGVISNPETNDKLGNGSPLMRPKVSFLDPSNTFTVSPYQTACGGADILSHIIEEYFSMDNDLYMLDCVMESLMKTVIKYTPVAIAEPNNYEARANLMWASSWAINGFIDGGKEQSWTCHPIEHEVSAYYDITHGLGLAIITPRWMEYVLNEKTAFKFKQLGCNVFGIDDNLSESEVAKKSIELLKEYLYKTCGLKSNFTELGIDGKNIKIMSEKAARRGTKRGFVNLDAADIENILNNCL